jgi:hypothetical protein
MANMFPLIARKQPTCQNHSFSSSSSICFALLFPDLVEGVDQKDFSLGAEKKRKKKEMWCRKKYIEERIFFFFISRHQRKFLTKNTA